MTLWDAHMHTSFSGDAQTLPEEMADTARENSFPALPSRIIWTGTTGKLPECLTWI